MRDSFTLGTYTHLIEAWLGRVPSSLSWRGVVNEEVAPRIGLLRRNTRCRNVLKRNANSCRTDALDTSSYRPGQQRRLPRAF